MFTYRQDTIPLKVGTMSPFTIKHYRFKTKGNFNLKIQHTSQIQRSENSPYCHVFPAFAVPNPFPLFWLVFQMSVRERVTGLFLELTTCISCKRTTTGPFWSCKRDHVQCTVCQGRDARRRCPLCQNMLKRNRMLDRIEKAIFEEIKIFPGPHEDQFWVNRSELRGSSGGPKWSGSPFITRETKWKVNVRVIKIKELSLFFVSVKIIFVFPAFSFDHLPLNKKVNSKIK